MFLFWQLIKLHLLIATGPPKIYEVPQNTKVLENGTALFRCLATGTPTPDHSWYYNDTSIIVGDKYSIGGPGVNYGSLIIRRVEFSDRGEYTCVYNNSVKILSLDAALSVQGMVHISLSLFLFLSLSLSLFLYPSLLLLPLVVMVMMLWCPLTLFPCGVLWCFLAVTVLKCHHSFLQSVSWYCVIWYSIA